VARILAHRGAAVFDEAIEIEQFFLRQSQPQSIRGYATVTG
jgi:hypothetical protein